MNLKRIICMITAFLICINVSVSAETRNIYIGDIITLEIASEKVSEEELRQKFQDFEIVGLKKERDVYSISIQTFEVGEYTIIVGNKELIISVASTLDDIQRDDVFEAEANLAEPGFSFHWRILFCVTAGAFVMSAGAALIKMISKRKSKPVSPYQLFLRRTSGLSAGDDNYFVDLTLFFKEYVESVNKRRIIGKTTSEIVSGLNGTESVKDIIHDIRKWLTDCDAYKFSGISVSDEEKHRHYVQLLSLVERIEKNQVGINEGTA